MMPWSCPHCGTIHVGVCPRIKRIHSDGTVEYHPPQDTNRLQELELQVEWLKGFCRGIDERLRQKP